MDNKNFVGFFIIGATNKEDAQKGAGLILWSKKRPNFITRFLDKVLLNIFWVDKKDYNPGYKEENTSVKTEYPKYRNYKKTK